MGKSDGGNGSGSKKLGFLEDLEICSIAMASVKKEKGISGIFKENYTAHVAQKERLPRQNHLNSTVTRNSS